VFLDVLLPFLALCGYALVYRAIGAPDAFVGFVILGGAMTAFWLNVLWSMANQLFWERDSGNLALYMMAPASLAAILLGMAVGGLVSTTLRAITILVIGSWLFGVQFHVTSVPLLVLTLASTLAALYGLGMMFASLFVVIGRKGWHFITLAQEPVYLLSGMYFPLRTLNVWVAGAACILPLALGLDAIRQVVVVGSPPAGLLPAPVETLILAGLAGVFLALARLLLTYMERRAILEGRLTETRG
jgi:ABC-2 type transport system permease protein